MPIITKQNKALIIELVRTDFKLRYQGSVLGYLWSLIKPLLLFGILYIVFVKFLRIGGSVPHYPIYLLSGVVMWSFFSETTNQGLVSIVARGDLIRKIRIPRWMIVFSASLSACINFFLNMSVVVLFMLISDVNISFTVLFAPLFILELYIFSLGISLFLSALFVRLRDVSHIWEVFLQAGFYLTPVIYPLSLISNVSFQKLLLLNPVAQVLQDIRYSLVTHETLTISSVYQSNIIRVVPVIITIITFVVGVLYFKKHALHFAEDL